MIELLRNKESQLIDLLDIVKSCNNEEFYYTENNERKFIENTKDLKKLFKTSHHIFYEYDDVTGKKGVILVWKSFGGDIKRSYVKFVADSEDTVRRLLTILLWNYGQELYLKVNKNSPFVRLFRAKGFKFMGGRGTQVLLMRPKYTLPIATGTVKNNVSTDGHNLESKKYNPGVLSNK